MLTGLLAACAALSLSRPHARADQRRDYMLDLQPEGTFAIADYFGTGMVLALEHRLRMYGSSNDLTTGAAVVGTYPLGEVQARADLRVLFLSIGGTLAYRTVWRNLTFEPGEDSYCADCDRGSRRDRDELFGRSPGTDAYGWGELRASVFLPFNEHLIMANTGALRWDGRRDRTYDWFYTSIYDGGMLGRFESQLFIKHRDWGGIGPYLQLLMLPRAGDHQAQWAFGFNAVTRLGVLPRNDLLFLTFLIRPGDEQYGQHSYFAPIRALLMYRMLFSLE